MNRNNDDHSDDEDVLSPGYDANSIGNNQRREPRFGSFDNDDEDAYEEPDRDTDYVSGFSADSVEEEEEEFEDTFPDENEDEEDSDLLSAEDDDADYRPASVWSERDQSVAEEPDAWLQQEGYLDEDEDSIRKWPLGLIAVAIVALVLLSAGGYGVMQQRAATQQELTQLRAALATTARPEDASSRRDALQSLQQSYDKLAANAEALTLENRRLTDTVAGLQAQLGVQQAVLTKTLPAANPVKPPVADAVASLYKTKPRPSANQVQPATVRDPVSAQQVAPQPIEPEPVKTEPVAPESAVPKPAAPQSALPKPAATQSPPATSSGPWFVNFGSYATRNVAESWSGKLHPGAGKVIIAPSTKDGQTLYRLRVVGLASRDSAQEVAHQLETQLRVSALWVGRE